MKKLLLTGFGAFGPHKLNTTIDILDSIDDKIDNIKIEKLILPVEYNNCFNELLKAIKSLKPDYVLSMGLAGNTKNLSIERIAVNIANATLPDNAGITLCDEIINKEGKAAYFTKIPFKRLLEAGRKIDSRVNFSYSAGTYICNNTFYKLMEYIEECEPKLIGGFIHVPYNENFDKEPFIKNIIQVDIVKSFIKALGESNG